MNPQIAVMKVGGSLFAQRNFVPRLQTLTSRMLKELAPVHLVLITGGGLLVEALRATDRLNTIAREHAHWTAIQLMDINARLLQHWWPQLHAANSLEELRDRCTQEGITQFRVEEFLRNSESKHPGTRLPIGWEVTSDSIAARVAVVMGAEQLILIKSTQWPGTADWKSAAAAGIVDSFFPTIARQLGLVRVVTLLGIQMAM